MPYRDRALLARATNPPNTSKFLNLSTPETTELSLERTVTHTQLSLSLTHTHTVTHTDLSLSLTVTLTVVSHTQTHTLSHTQLPLSFTHTHTRDEDWAGGERERESEGGREREARESGKRETTGYEPLDQAGSSRALPQTLNPSKSLNPQTWTPKP